MNEMIEHLTTDAPVKEIGNFFRRILHFIDSVAEGEVLMLANINLSDGIWRMIVEEEAKCNFSYTTPELPGTPPRLVVPSDLQMG